MAKGEVNFAVGDTVRITGNGWDVSRKHRIDNGRIDVIKAFTPKGDIVLSNGWVVGKDFAHIKHGLVQTSPATQSKTDDIVLAAMNKASLGAMGAEQAYVTVSRGRERGMIFTDLPRDELLQAIARGDNRLSATELLQGRKPAAAAAGGEGGKQDAQLHGKGAARCTGRCGGKPPSRSGNHSGKRRWGVDDKHGIRRGYIILRVIRGA